MYCFFFVFFVSTQNKHSLKHDIYTSKFQAMNSDTRPLCLIYFCLCLLPSQWDDSYFLVGGNGVDICLICSRKEAQTNQYTFLGPFGGPAKSILLSVASFGQPINQLLPARQDIRCQEFNIARKMNVNYTYGKCINGFDVLNVLRALKL